MANRFGVVLQRRPNLVQRNPCEARTGFWICFANRLRPSRRSTVALDLLLLSVKVQRCLSGGLVVICRAVSGQFSLLVVRDDQMTS